MGREEGGIAAMNEGNKGFEGDHVFVSTNERAPSRRKKRRRSERGSGGARRGNTLLAARGTAGQLLLCSGVESRPEDSHPAAHTCSHVKGADTISVPLLDSETKTHRLL